MTDPTATPPTPKARVLVVDDEAHVRSGLKRSLMLLGYSADVAASGRQALEMLARTSYDAMVLDVRMPGMDGIEVMQRAGEMYPDLSIILLTGHGTLESAIAAVRSRAADYLLKPASVHDIAAAIARASQRHARKLRRQRLLEAMGQALNEVARIESPREISPRPTQERVLRAGPVTLDRESCLVTVAQSGDVGGRNARLTVTEAVLLACLMQRPGVALSCCELARSALGCDVDESSAPGIVRPHICRLRKKIEPDPGRPRLVCTIPGQGYLFAP